MASSKIFPINTATSCQAKWSWSTLYLNTGETSSCHRTSRSLVDVDDFDNFHNTDLKIKDRKSMLNGVWPEESCSYCRKLEEAGGVSDRYLMNQKTNGTPDEFDVNESAVTVTPTLVEVFFNNTCNLGCLYCHSGLSSVIATEDKKFGTFKENGVEIIAKESHYRELIPKFWNWFDSNFASLTRLHILGGEPFYQKDFYNLLDKIESNPNPNCELVLVSNLMIDTDKLISVLDKFKKLLKERKLKRVDLTCSIDCWGAEQEFVRSGLNLELWEKNFNELLKRKWLYLTINQTITVLTVKTMPELLTRLAQWRTKRSVGQYFSLPSPGPSYMYPSILGSEEFKLDFKRILELMTENSDDNKKSYEYMSSISNATSSTDSMNLAEIKKLITYLDEKDRRRGTNWANVFPWLVKYKEYVV